MGWGGTHSKHPRDEGAGSQESCTTGKQGADRQDKRSSQKEGATDKKQKTPRSHLGT